MVQILTHSFLCVCMRVEGDQMKKWVWRCFTRAHHVFTIPGDETVGGKTIKFSYTMRKKWGCLEIRAFASTFHISPQIETRVISRTQHSPPHLSLYSLFPVRVYLTTQKSLKTMLGFEWPKSWTFHPFSKYQSPNCTTFFPDANFLTDYPFKNFKVAYMFYLSSVLSFKWLSFLLCLL